MSNLAVPGANGVAQLNAKQLAGVFTNAHDIRSGPAKTVLQVTPTITAGAYAAGHLIGFAAGAGNGLFSFANAVPLLQDTAGGGQIIAGARVKNVLVVDKDSQSSALELWLFNANPTATTFTDGSTLTVNSADLAKLIGILSIPSTAYAAVANCSQASIEARSPIGDPYPGGLDIQLTTQTLYAALICRGTPTYTTTSSLILSLLLNQE